MFPLKSSSLFLYIHSLDGTGIFISDDGSAYIGDWLIDQFHGQGLMLFPEGGYVYSTFNRNQIDGIGVIKYDGFLIAGNFSRNKLNGRVNIHCIRKKRVYVGFSLASPV